MARHIEKRKTQVKHNTKKQRTTIKYIKRLNIQTKDTWKKVNVFRMCYENKQLLRKSNFKTIKVKETP